jgi:uncharacterized protein (TIGR02271 family)
MQQDDDVLQIVTETATLQKRDVVTGRVRVHTQTQLSEELVSAALERHDVEISRVAIGREVDAAPPVRTEGNTTIIPVVEEILVVETRLVLREEIHIRQTTTTQAVEVPVTLRKQQAVIETDNAIANANEEDT